MFGLFKKKEDGIKVTEKIVIDEIAKLRAMQAYWNLNKNTVFIFWFDDTLTQAESFFAQSPEPVPLLTARGSSPGQLAGKNTVFGEHHPLRSKEMELYKRLGISTAIVFSSLNEPLFKRFGSDKIIKMMKQFGISEDEVIEHAMISKSIQNAQDKIEKKIVVEHSAHSQQDWLEKNIPGE